MAESNLIGMQVQGYTITRKLGSGGYGSVYLAVKEDLGKQYQAAVKHISIPDADAYETVLQDYNFDKNAVQAHFEKMVEGITSEINTLLSLSKKDNRYTVTYYDHSIQKIQEPLHYDIFMRMEYLLPLNKVIRRNGMTLGEIIKFGLNMCDALILCHGSDVVHRDIKEANIFVNESGNYKLGDFGVAKVALESTQAGSLKGTASYMAPEIYLREPYDKSVDIYSLGIVLYKLLNNQRLPFMPDAPASFTADDKNNAETRRLKGETPPLPFHAKNPLGEIVIKACAAKDRRYSTAEELKKDLSSIAETLTKEEKDAVIIPEAAEGNATSDSFSSSRIDAARSATVNSRTLTQGAQNTTPAVTSAPVPSERQNPYAGKSKDQPAKAPKTRSAKKTVAIAAVITGIIAIGALAFVLLLSKAGDPVSQLESALDRGEYDTASQIYLDELRYGDSAKLTEAEELIIRQAEETETAYINNEIEYDEARAKLQELEKLKIVSSDKLSPYIDSVNELRTSRLAYISGQDSLERSDYEQAISEFKKVIQRDENYDSAQQLIISSTTGYKNQVFEQLTVFDADKAYTDALSHLNNALRVVPSDADFLAKIDDYNKKIADEEEAAIDALITVSKELAQGGDYDRAIGTLQGELEQYPGNLKLTDAIDELVGAHVKAIISDAEGLASERKFSEALAALKNAQDRYTENASLSNAVDKITDLHVKDI